MHPLYKDGWPDLAAIKAAFPTHGSGQLDHKTTSGESFVYGFEQVGSVYWIRIVLQPTYADRSDDVYSTHRIWMNNGGYRVCVTREPTDLPSAIAYAMLWGECTSRYIHTGTRF